MLFRDRAEAGRHLAERLRYLQGGALVVLGLPRGGVAVAAEVARVLDAPLDVIVVRKLGVPFQPELAMGAVGEGGALVVNERVAEPVASQRGRVRRGGEAGTRAGRRPGDALPGRRSSADARGPHGGGCRRRDRDGLDGAGSVPGGTGAGRSARGSRRTRVLTRRGVSPARRGRRARVPGGSPPVPRRGPVLCRLPPDPRPRGRGIAAAGRSAPPDRRGRRRPFHLGPHRGRGGRRSGRDSRSAAPRGT